MESHSGSTEGVDSSESQTEIEREVKLRDVLGILDVRSEKIDRSTDALENQEPDPLATLDEQIEHGRKAASLLGQRRLLVDLRAEIEEL